MIGINGGELKRVHRIVIAGAILAVIAVTGREAFTDSLADTFNLGPVPPRTDLRNMLREHIVRRSCGLLEAGAASRRRAFRSKEWMAWRDGLREAVLRQMAPMPFGGEGPPLNIRLVSTHQFSHCDVENVLFESFPGWDVNASVFLPKADAFPPPWKAVVIPVGHSAKVRRNYQIPAQAFARLGYAAVIFDPPGMAGEKQGGNDHFDDGVRCYLTGRSSNRYFVLDAIRCIDYLATRADIDLSSGVAMSGVSGGGTTTMFATLLDGRIRAAGPACCAVPNARHPVLDGYAPCTETLASGRYASGIDAFDLLCAAAPTPVFLMCGEEDEVFKIEWSREVSGQVRDAFKKIGHEDRYDFYADPGGHAYTVEMAVRFAKWMNRWLENDAERTWPELSGDDFQMIPDDRLRCGPRTDGNMYSLNRALAIELRRKRAGNTNGGMQESAVNLAGVEMPVAVPRARSNEPFQVWFHALEELLLLPEPGIELPATLLMPLGEDWNGGALLFFDDRGRWAGLRQQGMLAGLAGFLQEDSTRLALLTVALRGWGDTAPADLPYEIAGWGNPSRWIAYVSAAAGDPVLAMRIRDGLASLAYLRDRGEIDPSRIVVGGYGMGGVVALHVAAIDGRIAGAFCIDGLASFESLAVSQNYTWSHEDFYPGVLCEYDLPELAASLDRPLLIANPLDAVKEPLTPSVAESTYREAMQTRKSFHLKTGPADPGAIRNFVRECTGGRR